ncbi:MAG TPA: MEDS domain-containing protein [Candidatus Limnocylindria bacterium]
MTDLPLGVTADALPVPGHICFFHDTYPELRAVLGAIAKPTLADAREGLVLLGAPGVAQRLLHDLDVDTDGVGEALAGGRVLQVESDRDADEYLERIRGALDELIARGVETTRAIACVAWNAPDFPLPEDHLWLESRLNEILAPRRTVLICTYDISEMPGAALTYGGLETHPHVIFAGRLSESPRFIPPEEFMAARLLELRWLAPDVPPAP